MVSTRSRPKAAEQKMMQISAGFVYVSTRSRPKAADFKGYFVIVWVYIVSTRSRPKAAELRVYEAQKQIKLFQHAAARRRLRMVGFMF